MTLTVSRSRVTRSSWETRVASHWGPSERRGSLPPRKEHLNLRFYDLRCEAGSRWMEAGVPLATIQEWLDHGNISRTSKYLATTTPGEHEAMRRFDERNGRLIPIDTAGVTPPQSVNSRSADRPTVTSSDTRRPVSGPDVVAEVILGPVDSMSARAPRSRLTRDRGDGACRRASRAVAGVDRFTTLECVAGARCALRPRGVRNDDGAHRLPGSPRRCRLPAA